MDDLRFTLWEVLSVIGVVQCIYILVYVTFRAAQFRQVILPALYFFGLGSAFFLDFARGYIAGLTPYYDVIVWAAWAAVLPLSVLLIVQILQLSRLPAPGYWLVLGFVPLSFALASIAPGVLSTQGAACSGFSCPDFKNWLNNMGLIFGALSLLLIWGQRKQLDDLHAQKAGQERYWLVIALVCINIAFLGLSVIAEGITLREPFGLTRTVLGLTFIYLVTTSLFRIYPVALVLTPPRRSENPLNAEEQKLAARIDTLLTMDKVYHEPTYSRADLAKELGVSEASVSRVINLHYKKSLPQLLNEQRIADAKRLLLDTNANIKIVAQEVGFNSIPSFNRVFKELEGCAPSDYRKNMIK